MSDSQALDTFDGLDYEEIEQAVMETSRGRWFLTEFARRHKAADTVVLLGAIKRLENQIQAMAAEASSSFATRQLDGLEGLVELDGQPPDESEDAAGQSEIADKLDRTAKLVRRLRSSHKLISEAAEKPLRSPLPLSNARPRTVASGNPPGFVGSDDDIFTDNKDPQFESGSQDDETPEIADAPPEFAYTPAFDGDTLKFAEIEMSDLAPRSDDDLTAEQTPDQSGQQAVTASPPAQVDGPAEDTEQPADLTAATEATPAVPDETGAAPRLKKRIVVIRRPADHPGDIPLAGSNSEVSGGDARPQ